MSIASETHSLLNVTDLGRSGFLAMLDLAADLKAQKSTGTEQRQLVGKNIALIFEKSSTRTRCAFEVAAYDQGAHVTYLGPEGSHLGREESVEDTAHVLGAMFDGIEFRGFAQDDVAELAAHAGVPVWNGLTDQWHPTQMLADVLTMREVRGVDVGEISFCFVGDGRSNVARSLLLTGAMLGMDVRIAAPSTLWPPDDVQQLATAAAADSGSTITITEDLTRAVEGAQFVYTDVWVSMGEKDEEWDKRVPVLSPYRITSGVMASTGLAGASFMHCLPAIHDTRTDVGRRVLDRYGMVGCEVTDDVFRSPASVVFQQAENRMHTIKALLISDLVV
jgi:ornithine carbamoyltransferase